MQTNQQYCSQSEIRRTAFPFWKLLDLLTIAALALLGTSFRPSSALKVNEELVVCAHSTLTAYDVSGGYPGQVTIKLPAVGIYVGSYRHVPVEVGKQRSCF